MLTRRTLGRLAIGMTAGLASGCSLVPTAFRPAGSQPAPNEPFGDFTVTNYLSGAIWEELRVFTDGAAVQVSSGGGTGGRLDPQLMERLRSLVGSDDFQRDLTRPLDKIESRVCDRVSNDTGYAFRMGGLSVDLPCTNNDRPALDEFLTMIKPYLFSHAQFEAKLPSGQPDLPKVVVHQESDGQRVGTQWEVRPDGTMLETDDAGEQTEVTLTAPALDALRLILRTEPCASTEQPSLSFVYVVQVADRAPVTVSQFSGEVVKDCVDHHAIAQIIAGVR
ncbi:hypothetical protein [Microlunatus sp. GCM10028923]|uniref:hypothetical protein n=1 Tax=Microlunatus sp. GCM10028923 TaxID=3273400 RepID=UPI0036173B1C